ncbi:uncharacterized protein BT62DRAFT_1011604 [Guyanagaster necrorhizus]|uniref:Uncharacterized protein n=1 Tax=Guyanagaster necrorhizus TaxID=856835 RepID=A0A9P7VIY6_9AGAR|nr:uncharacterized protein BT62DRAFT_1011604 [Guyanagaster necrorhizus MCA 3950]KAG7441357.1 hypothetical protein BT62DRAFT_1011604 [Guyanagaster necrorhizus MCA 3950]
MSLQFKLSNNSAPHPITDIAQGLVLEYIPGVSMDKLRPGDGTQSVQYFVGDPLRFLLGTLCVPSRRRTAWFITIPTRGMSFCERGACLPSLSILDWHTSGNLGLVMNGGMWSSMEVQIRGTWEGFWATFDRVLGTDWEGAREQMFQWRIKPGSSDVPTPVLKCNEGISTWFTPSREDGCPQKNTPMFVFLLRSISRL